MKNVEQSVGYTNSNDDGDYTIPPADKAVDDNIYNNVFAASLETSSSRSFPSSSSTLFITLPSPTLY